jgi:Fic family protein
MYDIAKLTNRDRFKTEPNYITETVNGVRQVRFVAVAPKDTELAVEQLLLAYYEASHDPEIHPLLLIPCVVLDFLCIHPFDDGNGRISRLLTLILLYKSGFDIGRFISIENTINENKDEYYASLHESSFNWHEGKNDYSSFIKYMMQILYLCYTKLDENAFSAIDTKSNKGERIETIVKNAFVPISKKKICELLPDVSEKMIETVLGRLVKEGTIVKIGSYKNATYYRK